jgi:site-specific DNA recombinase
MVRAAIYGRVSTDEQAEKYGLASQLHETRALAARKGYDVVAEFVDDGISGATIERPALTRLREALRAKAYDVVLVYDPDRLARELFLLLMLDKEIERAGARVEYVSGSYEDTPAGRMFYQFKGVIAEYERGIIRERTKRGKAEKARRGLVSYYPYGYGPLIEQGKPAGRMLVHEDEASTVRMIFDWYVTEQRSIRSITVELRRLGLRAQKGGVFGKSMVRKILANRAYIGETSYEGIPIAIPAIVDLGVFERAQEQLDRNRAILAGRPTSAPFLLRGLVRCGLCRRTWYADASRSTHAYRCRGGAPIVGEKCRTRQVAAARLDGTVWEAVVGVLRNPAALRAKLESAAGALNASSAEIQSEVQHLRRQLEEAGRQEHRLLDLFLDESMRTDAVRGRLEALSRRRAALRERLARAEEIVSSQSAQEAKHEAIERQCAQILRGIDRLTFEERQMLLRTLLDEVVVSGNEVEIHGVLPPAKPTTMAA